MAETSWVDTHLHLWDLDRLTYPWLREVPGIQRTHWVDEYLTATGGHPPEAVFVQADCLDQQGIEEVDAVSSIATTTNIIGIIAFAPLDRFESLVPWLEDLQTRPLVKGVRFLLQDLPMEKINKALRRGIELIGRFGMTFDVCVRRHQLPHAAQLVADLPEVAFVLDHLGKPQIDGSKDDFLRWQTDITRLAAHENIYAKLSGLATEALKTTYESPMLVPHLEHAISVFGANRLMVGSDWPVSTLATTYSDWWSDLSAFVSNLDEREKTAIWSGTARRFYRLAGPPE